MRIITAKQGLVTGLLGGIAGVLFSRRDPSRDS
jgi:hypothetical protein